MTETLAQLVDRCLAGDEAAWRAFVDRHSRLVYLIPRRNRFDDSACDDIFQEVFLAAFRNLDSLRDPQTVPKWLITTAVRACARHARKNKSQALPKVDERVTEPELERQERLHALHRGLDEIGSRCKELLLILHARTSAGGYDQIAEELGIPRGSIGPTRQRCLEKLARVIGEQSGEIPSESRP